MMLDVKYEFGSRVWVGYKDKDEIHLYDDVIKEVSVAIVSDCIGDRIATHIEYFGDKCPEGIPEENIVLYDDDIALTKLIRRLNDDK